MPYLKFAVIVPPELKRRVRALLGECYTFRAILLNCRKPYNRKLYIPPRSEEIMVKELCIFYNKGTARPNRRRDGDGQP
jgi:hypothetical protein